MNFDIDIIDVNYKPMGWEIVDNIEELSDGIISGTTIITDNNGNKGYFTRLYSTNDTLFSFEEAFPGAIPIIINDDKLKTLTNELFRTQAYFTLRLMKLMEVPLPQVQKVKMRNIHRAETMLRVYEIMETNTYQSIEEIPDNIQINSTKYCTFTMKQAGFSILERKIEAIKNKTRKITVTEAKELEYDVREFTDLFLQMNNITVESFVYIGFDINFNVKYHLS